MTINELVRTEIYDRINTSIKITSQESANGDTYINSCDFKWLELVRVVYIDGIEYNVVESDIEAYAYKIVNYVGEIKNIKLKNFYFYEGTAIDVAQVFAQTSNLTWNKLPMMWLSFNPLPIIRGQVGTVNPYPYSNTFTLYLAGETDYANRHTKEHMQEVVTYLNEYAEQVVKAIEGNRTVFAQEFSYQMRQLPIFARYNQSGATENILDKTNMSAIELELDVNTSKKCKC